MKKIILLIGFLMFLFAQDDKYLIYVNKLVNYNFDLKTVIDKAPFEYKAIKNKKTAEKVLVKKVKIKLLSIFDNQAYIKILVYLGEQLIKSYNKWVKKGDFLYYCKVDKIELTKIYLKCKDKTLIKTVDKKMPGFKEKE